MITWFWSFIQIETLSQIDFYFFNKNYDLYIQHNPILRLETTDSEMIGTLEVD